MVATHYVEVAYNFDYDLMMTSSDCVHGMDDNLHCPNTWFLHFTSSRESGEILSSPYHPLSVDLSLVGTATQSLQMERLLAQQQLDCVSYILWDTCLTSTGMHVPAYCGCLCCMTI